MNHVRKSVNHCGVSWLIYKSNEQRTSNFGCKGRGGVNEEFTAKVTTYSA